MTNIDPTIALLLGSSAERAICQQLLTASSDSTWHPIILDLDGSAVFTSKMTQPPAHSPSSPPPSPQPQIVVLDKWAYETHWAELHTRLGDTQPAVLLLLDDGDEAVAVSALQAGIHDYLVKSQINEIRFRHTVQLLWQHQQLQRQLATCQLANCQPHNQQHDILNQAAISCEQTEAVLHQTETQLLLSLEFANIGAWCWWPDTDQYAWYGGMEALLELPPGLEDMFGQWCDRIHPDDQDAVLQAIEHGLAHQTAFEAEYRYRLSDQRWVWRYVKGQGQYSSTHQLKQVLGVLLDIDEQKQNEAALQKSERKHRALINALPDLIIRMSGEGIYLDFFAASTTTVLGSSSDLTGRSIYEQGLPHELAERRMHYIQQALATGELQVYEQELFNGEATVTEEVRIVPSGDNEILILVRDITERKRAEAALQMSEQRLQMLINALPFGVWVRDAHDRLVLQNTVNIERFGNHLGAVPYEVPGLPDYAPIYFESKRRCQLGEYIHIERNEIVAGQERYFHRIVGPFPDLNGTIGMFGVYIDITDRKLAEAQLQEVTQRLTLATNAAEIGIWDLDLTQDRLLWDDRMYEIYGRTPSQSVHSTEFWEQCLHPQDAPAAKASLQATLDGEQEFHIEFRIVWPNGKIRFIEAHAITLRDADGKALRMTGVNWDISDRKLAEIERQQAQLAVEQVNRNLEALIDERTAALRIREQELASLFNSAAVGMAQVDSQTHQFTKVNQRFCELLGYSPAELAQFNFVDITYADDVVPSQTAVEQLYQKEISDFTLEKRYVRKDGRLLWANTTVSVVWHPDGTPAYSIVVIEDISARQQTETALRESEARLRATFEQAAVGIVQANVAGQLVQVNQKFCDLVGYSDVELLRHTFFDITHPDDLAQDQINIQRLLMDEISTSVMEKRYIRRDGTAVWTNLSVSLVRDWRGEPQYFIGVVQDIRDRKQAEQQLQSERLRLELALEAAQMGTWEATSLEAGNWSERTEAIFGYGSGEFPGDRDSFLKLVYGDDQDRILAALMHSFSTRAPYSEEYRIHRLDGELRWVSVSGKVVATENGTGLRIVGVVVDITERKQAEEALRDSEERLRLALAAADQGLYDLDLQTGDAVVSPTYATMLGYDPATFHETNAKWLQRLHPDDHERVGEVYRAYVAGEIPEYKVEFRQRMRNGRWKWILSLGKIVAWDQQGNPLRMLGTHTDMDERRQAEEALRASEERFRQIAENINEVFWLTDLQHEILYVSPTYERIWGKSTQNLGLEDWQSSVHPDDRDRILPFMDAESAGYSEVEYRIIRPDGEIRWIRDRAFPIRDTAGQVYRIAGIAEDISDRKRLEEDQARLLAILEASSDYIGISSPDGQIIWMNRQLKQLRDLPADVRFGQIPVASCHPDWAWQTIVSDGIPTAMRNGIWVEESAVLSATGIEIPVSLLLIAHQSPTGQLEYLSAIMRDITALKQAEENLRQINLELEQRVAERTLELVESKEAAEAANRAKSVFLANMSHELRTPLNAILGFSQLMARDLQLPSKHSESLKIINRSGEHLLALINDILEMSKIEAGRVTLNATDFSLLLLLESLADMLQFKAESKGLAFTITYPPNLPSSIQADNRKLRQVLINLLGNAIKFTQAGSVALRVGFRTDVLTCDLEHAPNKANQVDNAPPSPPNPGTANPGTANPETLPSLASAPLHAAGAASPVLMLRFEVEDTGCGIAPTELDVLFDPFVQSSNGRYSAQEGTGLGLSISQQFVRLMGGEIWVESQVGVGSTFAFEIPVQIGAADYAEERTEPQRRVLAIAPDQPHYRILIAEDNLGNRMLLQDLLTELGFSVQAVTNGQEAVDCWHTWRPHLIFMDIRMPILDGYAATQMIRQQERQMLDTVANANLVEKSAQPFHHPTTITPAKIIALTAGTFEDHPTEFQGAGCDAFMRKPIREAEIIQLLADQLGVRYLYESLDLAEHTATASQKAGQKAGLTKRVTKITLQALPYDWILQFHNAITQLDQTLMFALIKQLPHDQADLAQALEQKIHNFDYEMLLDLIQDIIHSNESQL